MALVQLTHLGNFETLEAEIFQACFLNIFAPFFFFFSICQTSRLLKPLKQFYYGNLTEIYSKLSTGPFQ